MCEDARRQVLDHLPPSVTDVLTSCAGPLRQQFSNVLSQVWQEFALPAARAWRDSGSLDSCTAEARCVWQCLPWELREELEGFVAQQSYDSLLVTQKTQDLLIFS